MTGMIAPGNLLRAYASGIFPMAMDDGRMGWFSPDPRGILPLDGFRVPHGLRRTLRRQSFEVRVDTAFGAVMDGCADREETWIDERIFRSYRALADLGFGHSVEAWRGGELAGGLYGVALGGAFFGESMFSRETDASKVCLVHLVERLRAGGFRLLDIQWTTPHLEKFGAVAVPRDEYLHRLEEAMAVRADWRAWDRHRESGVAGSAWKGKESEADGDGAHDHRAGGIGDSEDRAAGGGQ